MSCRITADQTITIPPQSEHIIQGKVLKRGDWGPCSVTEQVSSFAHEQGLITGKVLINPSMGIFPMCIVNPSDEPKVVQKNTVLAVAHPVSKTTD